MRHVAPDDRFPRLADRADHQAGRPRGEDPDPAANKVALRCVSLWTGMRIVSAVRPVSPGTGIAMPHFLLVAALVLAAWAVLSVPLGVLVGRRLKHVNPRTLPAGCAFRTGVDARASA